MFEELNKMKKKIILIPLWLMKTGTNNHKQIPVTSFII